MSLELGFCDGVVAYQRKMLEIFEGIDRSRLPYYIGLECLMVFLSIKHL